MRAEFAEVIGNELVVVWDDGHESYFSAEMLRRECPCAHCAGESDLFGRVARGPEQELTKRSFQLTTAARSGNYGLQVEFADGHAWGIWTFERLRAACSCETCRAAAETGGS